MGLFDHFKKKTSKEIKPKKPGGHGDHWQIVSGYEGDVESYVIGAIENAGSVESVKRRGKEIEAYFSQDDVLKTCTITINNGLWTAYPFISEGVVHEIEIISIEEWMNEQEAQIRCSLGDASLAFFDTMYFKNKNIYEPGKKYQFSLSALAYSLNKAGPRTLKDNEGRDISTEGMAVYFPFERGDMDDFVFQFPVKEVMKTEFSSKPAYKIKAPLFRLGGNEDINIHIFVMADAIGDYVPAPGEDISGIMWLQGYLK